MIESNDLVGRLREPDSHDPACPFRDRCYCDSAASHDNVMDDLKLEAADLIQSLSDRIAVLEGENARLREALWGARQQAKRRGQDMLRDEANAVLPHFQRKWEPLRAVAERTGHYSAQQLASRARDLRKRGLVEQRWNDGVMRISEWRIATCKR